MRKLLSFITRNPEFIILYRKGYNLYHIEELSLIGYLYVSCSMTSDKNLVLEYLENLKKNGIIEEIIN